VYNTSNYRRKLEAVFLVFFIFLLLCIIRLMYLQFFRASFLANIGRKQHSLYVELEARRGTIYDSNQKPEAVNIATDSVYAAPNEMKDKDKEAAIRQLSPILNISESNLQNKIYRKKSFVWIQRKISAQQAQQIRQLKIKGIDFIKESKRCYPNAYLASQVIGFAGLDNQGLEGLELYYDKYLKGKNGFALFLRDARQKKLDLKDKTLAPRDGYDLELTIDEVIQYIAERELDNSFRVNKAKGASIIVMEPHTGEILAMASRPTYDLNEYSKVDKEQVRNRAICDMFEPGSVFKVVAASAALEEKMASEQDKFFCENGAYRVGNHILHDHTPHGWLTFTEVVEQSSNIGTTKIAQLIGPDMLYKYVRKFGFGTKTGIDMRGEINGSIKEPRFWSKTSIGAIPIGHEVGVTALQLACAYSVIANGGKLMKPYIVKSIKDKFGQVIKSFSPVVTAQVISADTSARMRKILTGVIEEGTGKMAKMEGFSAAGKTGTAQKIEPGGKYSHNKFIGSFIGFAPAEEPLITIVVTIDEPRPYYYGGVVAAPVFQKVAADVLKYLRTKQLPDEYYASN
jgi:cell division protein FtsI/penicillin-binding protein 2